MNASYELVISPASEIASEKTAWIWDPETGERYQLLVNKEGYSLDLGPADLKLIVFDNNKNGSVFAPPKYKEPGKVNLNSRWSLRGDHINGSVTTSQLVQLRDLKELSDWGNFCGKIIYKNQFVLDNSSEITWISLGKTYGVTELMINGNSVGVKWYGRKIFNVRKFLKKGENTIEIKIVTTMGNYLKSLKDNAAAQFWTNEGRTIQPLQPTGLIGPVILY